ncbi:MAG: hypothetical protein ACJ79O_20410 [Myxococcales bacterium]
MHEHLKVGIKRGGLATSEIWEIDTIALGREAEDDPEVDHAVAFYPLKRRPSGAPP